MGEFRTKFIFFGRNSKLCYNPLTRALHLFPKPPADICEYLHVEFHVLSSKEDRSSFRVICVCHESFGAQAAVLSSETREWQVFPWVDAESMQPALHPGDDEHRHRYHDGTLANGSIYWTQSSEDSARVLNTAMFHFSRIDLPTHIEWQGAFTAGETKDGKKLCMAKAVKLTILLWLRGADGDGVEGWMLDKTFPLEEAINELMHYFPCDRVLLKILAIRDGVVYLCSYREVDPKLSGWFLSFCLETAKLEKLCPILDANDMYPYIMAWPPSLVLDKVNPRLNQWSWWKIKNLYFYFFVI
jgi:hypothetical protein